MASITLKNVPDELLERLRSRAQRNRRSLMKELLVLLEVGSRRPESEWGLRAGESTPVYGTGSDSQPLGAEQQRERQLETWRELCGQWESAESMAEEIEAIYSARTGGRKVEL